MKKRAFLFIIFLCSLYYTKEIKYHFRKIIEWDKIQIFLIDKCETCFLISNPPNNKQQLLKTIIPTVNSVLKHKKKLKDTTEYIFYFYKETKNLTRDFKHVDYDEWGWNWNYDEIWHHDENKIAEIHLLFKKEEEIRYNYYSQNPEGYNFYKYGIPSLGIQQPVWMIDRKYYDTTGNEIILLPNKMLQ